MSDSIRRSQLAIASDLEITENIWLTFNTELNLTKRKQMSDIIRLLFGGSKFAKVVIPSSKVLTLNSAPYDIIAAPGTGKAIDLVSCIVGCETYGGTPYATNIDIELITKTANLAQLELVGGLGFNLQSLKKMTPVISTNVADTQLLENLSVRAFEPTGDPTTGTSDLVLYVAWNEIVL